VLAIPDGSQLIWWQLLVKIPAGRIFLASFAALLLSSIGVAGLEFPERSISPSGQFVIYGADDGLRGSVSALAERIKQDVLSVLQQRDAWKIAIVINLQPRAVNLPEIPPSELRFSQTETGVKLQLDLTLSQELRPNAIERELARVIIVEMIYRNQTGITPGDVYVAPPVWLVEGLLASAPNRSRASLTASLSAPVRAPTLAEFLRQNPETLDLSARELYRAYSFVLVEMLIDSPNGRSRLGHYISNLAFASNDPMADFRASFPDVRDFESAWKSTLAGLSASLDKDLFSFSLTDEKLNQLLTMPSQDGKAESVSLENFSRGRLTSTQRTELRQLSRELLLLATRANPVLRPVVQDYQRIADQLILGKDRGIAKRLAELKSLRARLSARMTDVDDYLNWLEAAKLETPSGIFDDSPGTAAGDSSKPRRGDPLSVYLDAMELEF